MFVKVTLVNGGQQLVNSDHIIAVEALSNGGSMLVLSLDDYFVSVRESKDYFEHLLLGTRPGPIEVPA